MTKKLFAFKSNDPKILSYLDGKNIAEYLRKLVELDMKGAIGKMTLKDQKTKEEILNLQIKNKIAMIEYLKLEPSMAQEVHAGRLSLETAMKVRFGDQIPQMGVENPIEQSPEWEHNCKAAGRKIVFDRKRNPECSLCMERAS